MAAQGQGLAADPEPLHHFIPALLDALGGAVSWVPVSFCPDSHLCDHMETEERKGAV